MKYLGLLFIIVMSVLVGCSADAVEEPLASLSTVIVTEAIKENITKTYVSIGEVVPERQIDMIVTGNIDKIMYEVGDKVMVDDVLLTLKNDLVESSYQASESQLRTIRDNLGAQYQLAQEDLNKQKKLLDEGIISQAAYNQVENQVQSLRRQYSDASINYNSQLKQLKETLSNQLLTSTINGTIAAINVQEGQVVSNRLAINIIDDSRKYIKTSVSGDLKRQIAVGDVVKVMVNKEEHEGIISRIDELPNMNSKLFDIWIEANDGYDYMIGDFAEIEYILESYEAVVVPNRSLIRKNNETYLYVLNDNLVTKIQVETGNTFGELIEVSGLREGESVLVRGQNYVVDGEIVNPVGTE
jgi:RND family efflux transporter MFP subunit